MRQENVGRLKEFYIANVTGKPFKAAASTEGTTAHKSERPDGPRGGAPKRQVL